MSLKGRSYEIFESVCQTKECIVKYCSYFSHCGINLGNLNKISCKTNGRQEIDFESKISNMINITSKFIEKEWFVLIMPNIRFLKVNLVNKS